MSNSEAFERFRQGGTMKRTIPILVVHSVTQQDLGVEVRAVVRGEWALHRSYNLNGFYSVTHTPSGLAIDWIDGTLVDLAHALRDLASIPPCPIDPRTLKGKKEFPEAYQTWARQVAEALADVRAA